jgi:hypothetical protein
MAYKSYHILLAVGILLIIGSIVVITSSDSITDLDSESLAAILLIAGLIITPIGIKKYRRDKKSKK